MRPDAATLLNAPDLSIRDGRDLWNLLAAVALAPAATSRAAEALRDQVPDEETWETTLENFAAIVSAELTPKPYDSTTFANRAWLETIERGALAERSLDSLANEGGLPPPAASRLRDTLRSRLSAAEKTLAVSPGLWLHRDLANGLDAALQSRLLPWSILVLPEDRLAELDPDEALDAWMLGSIAEEAGTALNDAVRRRTVWRDRYRLLLQELVRVVSVTRTDSLWSLAYRDRKGCESLAAPRFETPLPHLGETTALRVFLVQGGTEWCFGDQIQREPEGTHAFTLAGDDVTGPLSVGVEEETATPWIDALDASESARALARGDVPSEAAVEIAIALARDFEFGFFARIVHHAAAAFDRGESTLDASAGRLPAPERCAELAFVTRLRLEEAAQRLDDDRVDFALASADQSLEGCGGAALWLDARTVRELAGDLILDPDFWWGAHEDVDDAAIHGDLLSALGTEPTFLEFDGSSLARRAGRAEKLVRLAAASKAPDGILPELESIPAPWLTPSFDELDPVVRAARLRPGVVPVLLYDRDAGMGRVGELRIAYADGAPFDADDPFGSQAAEAVRVAYDAAASVIAAGGLPGALFKEHHVRVLIEGDETFRIDGASLGLSATLAFVSLWTDRAIAPDVVCTGRVIPHAPIEPVVEVPAKLAAVAAYCGERTTPIRFIASRHHERHLTHVPAKFLRFVPVESIGAAVHEAGLDVTSAVRPWRTPDDSTLKRCLGELRDDVEHQRLDDHRVPGPDGRPVLDPWAMLGDKIRHLVDRLWRDKPLNDDAVDALCHAAIAYEHAGDDALLQLTVLRVETTRILDPVVRLLVAIVRVNVEIDHLERTDEEYDAKIREALKRIDAFDRETELRDDERERIRERIEGRLRGTQGRALLHLRHPTDEELERGIERHRQSVELHGASDSRHERGRSRVYLAMALRRAGRASEAATELALSFQDHHRDTIQRSRDYFEHGMLYWNYERARLAVEQRDATLAREHAERALRATVPGTWWPRAGILRTLAWAHALAGRDDRRRAVVAELRALLEDPSVPLPASKRSFVGRLLAEAQAGPSREGEVY